MSTDSISQLNAALEGRYVVDRQIGQGGMATVFLANDVRHDRRVAVKLLRPELAAVIGADRFLAEIKTTAGLQHPHILPLHDSGAANGTVFYVMPYVEGESLRDRLNREHQLPVDDAVRIAREVAGALDYAHRHGVVHRDIKPENILLHDGQALVADFGIALAVSRSEGGSRMTETGMSLGTPHYMAPEQAMGEREITPKADVYALGCVLYEMLTGDPPFTGSTAQAIVARTITESPRSMTLQRHTIPVHVEHAVLTALEKLPADRFATAGEFAAALDNPALDRRVVAATASTAGAASRSDWKSRIALPMTLVAAVAMGALVWTSTRAPAAAPVARYRIDFPPLQEPVNERGFAVSRDGSQLLYLGPDSNGSQLYVKARDRERGVPLAGTTGAMSFAFSPDGKWIAFTALSQLKKLPLVGGAAITLADSVMGSRGLAWLDNGTIVYVGSAGRAVRSVPEVGGAFAELVRADTINFWYPTPLPKSRGVLLRICRLLDCTTDTDLWAIDGKDKSLHVVERGVVRGEYVETGHVLAVRRDGAMLAIPFDLKSLSATGSPIPVLDSIALGVNAMPQVAVSSQGTLFSRTGPSSYGGMLYELVWVDRAGRELAIDTTFRFRLTSFGANTGWSLSPDGNRVAMGLRTDAGDQVWVKQLPTGPWTRVSFDSVQNFRPRWMRDGKTVMFTSRRALNAMLYKRSADGTGADELVLKVREPGIYEGSWSPDGTWLVFRAGGTINQTGGRDILAMRPGVDTVPKPLIASPTYDESAIAISPDGRWIAYESNETGPIEVFIRPFPNADGGKWQVSSGGGRAPLWAKNGRELFFINRARQMVVAPIAQGAVPSPGTPQILFRLREEIYLADQENYTPHDIHPDGQRFIMARRAQLSAVQSQPLVVVENWFTELRARVKKN